MGTAAHFHSQQLCPSSPILIPAVIRGSAVERSISSTYLFLPSPILPTQVQHVGSRQSRIRRHFLRRHLVPQLEGERRTQDAGPISNRLPPVLAGRLREWLRH